MGMGMIFLLVPNLFDENRIGKVIVKNREKKTQTMPNKIMTHTHTMLIKRISTDPVNN
jgi:hypothetical protein